MENGIFGSRDAQCEKCRQIYRLGDEHVCRKGIVKEHMDEPKDEEMVEVDETTTSSTEEEAPKKRKSKKE